MPPVQSSAVQLKDLLTPLKASQEAAGETGEEAR